LDIEKHAKDLEEASPDLTEIFKTSKTLKSCKRALGIYLSKREHNIMNPAKREANLHSIIAREAINVVRNIMAPGNEEAAGFSAIGFLYKIFRGNISYMPDNLSRGFFEEFRHLFLAVEGKSRVYEGKEMPIFLQMEGREAALERSDELDVMSFYVNNFMNKYKTGLDEDIVAQRTKNRKRILKALKGTEKDWNNWQWQLKHVAKTSKALEQMVPIFANERKAIDMARQNGIPFGVTPHYAHLMDKGSDRTNDHAVRAQVIPPLDYVEKMVARKKDRREAFDFMLERDTSPESLITRRYPMICIIKPYNACPQVCVYCQRNWEIENVLAKGAMASGTRLERAFKWLEEHPGIKEVLVTGGDPLVISNKRLREILERLASMHHIERIRIGTRILVTIPMRIDDDFIKILADVHQPPKREVCVITHVEHVYEITPEVMRAVQAIKNLGISVYNQLVYTFETSRRFETAALRRTLRMVGIEPYYTFCTKGKEETRHYRVPIARLLQEAKEEARLLPGVVRTDEAVYNVPKLGKNYLLRAQHHDIISILPDGRRIYEFHPWEKKIQLTETFVNADVSIWDYLEALKKRGEDPEDYSTIWYYY
jgi:lysine 2,3-aminomutase